MFDMKTNFNSDANQQTANILEQYNAALEKVYLLEKAFLIVKMNEFVGDRSYEITEPVVVQMVDDVSYFCWLKDFESQETALAAGFVIVPLMVKDSSITAPIKKVKYVLHISNRRLTVTLKDGEVNVTEDENSEAKPGVLYMATVYQGEEGISVQAKTLKAA